LIIGFFFIFKKILQGSFKKLDKIEKHVPEFLHESKAIQANRGRRGC
jgi:hypothetical protein